MVKGVKELFGNINFIFKLVEWILCLVTCVMIGDSNTSYYDWRLRDVVVVAAAGYFIITFALFLIYILDDTNILYELIVIFTGGVLNIVAGIMCIIHYADDTKSRGNTLIVAIFTIACGVVMIVDFVFLFKKK